MFWSKSELITIIDNRRLSIWRSCSSSKLWSIDFRIVIVRWSNRIKTGKVAYSSIVFSAASLNIAIPSAKSHWTTVIDCNRSFDYFFAGNRVEKSDRDHNRYQLCFQLRKMDLVSSISGRTCE